MGDGKVLQTGSHHTEGLDKDRSGSSYPNSVSLSYSNRVGQFNLNLSAMERPEHSHHLQQAVVQATERKQRTLVFTAGPDLD